MLDSKWCGGAGRGGQYGIVIVTLFLAGMCLLTGCRNEQAGPKNTLANGTPTVSVPQEMSIFSPRRTQPIIDFLLENQIADAIPYDVRIMEGPLVSMGIQGVLDGTFDMMIISRRPHPDEPLMFSELFRAPAAIYVNAEAGITNLSSAQVVDIFSGAITNWSQIGGADMAITVFVQECDDPMTDTFREHVFKGHSFVESATIEDDEQNLFFMLENIPGAVGYASWSGELYYEFLQNSELLNPVTLDGLHPSDPEYAFASSFGYAYLPERKTDLQPFIDFSYNALDSVLLTNMMARFGLTGGMTAQASAAAQD